MPTAAEIDDQPQPWRFSPEAKTASVVTGDGDRLLARVGIIFADAQGIAYFAVSTVLARTLAQRLLERADLVDGFNAD